MKKSRGDHVYSRIESVVKGFRPSSLRLRSTSAIKLGLSLAMGVSASLTPGVSWAGRNVGLVVLGGAQTTEQNFEPYIEATELAPSQVLIRLPDTNPFSANHARDIKNYQIDVQKFSEQNADGIVLFAYSGGGKFAAKLAQDNPQVRGIFLLDPVDGPPPFTKDDAKFPTILKDGAAKFNIPVFIVKSERGGLPGFLGVPCVTPGMGPDHFASYVSPEKLQFYTAPGASHLDFLAPPLKPLAAGACARSKEIPGSTRNNALTSWTEFWQKINAGAQESTELIDVSLDEQTRIDQLKNEVLAIAKLNNVRTDNLAAVRAELEPRIAELAKLNPTRGQGFEQVLAELDGIWHQLWTDNSQETSGLFKYDLAHAYQVFNAQDQSYMTVAESRIGPATTLNFLNVSLKGGKDVSSDFVGLLGKISFSLGQLPAETELTQLVADVKSGKRKTVGFSPAKITGPAKATLTIQTLFADSTLYISSTPRKKPNGSITTDLYILERVPN